MARRLLAVAALGLALWLAWPAPPPARPTAPPLDLTRVGARLPDRPTEGAGPTLAAPARPARPATTAAGPVPRTEAVDAAAAASLVPRSDAREAPRPLTRAEGPGWAPPASRAEVHVDGEIADPATLPRPSAAERHDAGRVTAGRVVPLTVLDPARPDDRTRHAPTVAGLPPSAPVFQETRAFRVPVWRGRGTDTSR